MKILIKSLLGIYIFIAIKQLFTYKMFFEKRLPTFIDKFSSIFFGIMLLLMPLITIQYKDNKAYIIFVWVITLLLILKYIFIVWNNIIFIT